MATTSATETHQKANGVMIVAAWCVVGIPLLWGVYETILKAASLFQ
jgi:hypothetical protein